VLQVQLCASAMVANRKLNSLKMHFKNLKNYVTLKLWVLEQF